MEERCSGLRKDEESLLNKPIIDMGVVRRGEEHHKGQYMWLDFKHVSGASIGGKGKPQSVGEEL